MPILSKVRFNVKRRIFIVFAYFIFIFPNQTLAQDPNDCPGAIVICSNGPVNYTPTGPGSLDFSTSSCGTTERQSAWYYFAFSNTMPPNQILEFTLTPTNGTDDYDFAMWGPDVSCADLDVAGMIRCNFDLPFGGNAQTGLVIGGGSGAINGFEEALKVFEVYGSDIHDATSGWNGQSSNKQFSEGTYIYQSTIRFSNEKSRSFFGELNLIR